MTPKASSTDDRALRTQGMRTTAKLLDAGMTVLADRGYHAARVDDIVRVADVSHGTFYLYFANKQELLRAMAANCAEEMLGVVESLGKVAPGPAGYKEVRRWLADFMKSYERYGVVIRAWMEDTASDRQLVKLGSKTFGAVSSSLVARIREASPSSDVDPDLAAAALLALTERYTYFATSRALPFDDDDVLDTLSAMIHRGFFNGRLPKAS